MMNQHTYEQYAANYAQALPGVSRDIKWGNNEVYSVADKMFLIISHDGTTFNPISFKVDSERFLELTEQPHIIPAPYLARHHWITLTDARALKKAELIAIIARSYQLVRARLPKKVRATLTTP